MQKYSDELDNLWVELKKKINEKVDDSRKALKDELRNM